jgi:4-azaleucine resistance transporter AzlC
VVSRLRPIPDSFGAGVVDMLPIAAGAIPFGLLFGGLAAQAGLSPVETGLMSALVFAGSAQFLAIQVWVDPVPIAALTLTALMVNLRHVLMGASIGPSIASWPRPRIYAALYFLADESWALATRRAMAGALMPAYYFGLAASLYLCFLCSTVAGSLVGALLEDPARYGFDFAFTAVFLVLLRSLWQGRRTLAPWVASAVAAVLAYHLLPSPWYILAGGLSGTLVGALQYRAP